MWSTVCTLAPYSQFAEEARPHLCMDKLKCTTPVCRQLNLSQAVVVKLIPMGLVLTLGMWTQSADILLEYSVSHVKFVHRAERTPNSDKLGNSFHMAGKNECLDQGCSTCSLRTAFRPTINLLKIFFLANLSSSEHKSLYVI